MFVVTLVMEMKKMSFYDAPRNTAITAVSLSKILVKKWE